MTDITIREGELLARLVALELENAELRDRLDQRKRQLTPERISPVFSPFWFPTFPPVSRYGCDTPHKRQSLPALPLRLSPSTARHSS